MKSHSNRWRPHFRIAAVVGVSTVSVAGMLLSGSGVAQADTELDLMDIQGVIPVYYNATGGTKTLYITLEGVTWQVHSFSAGSGDVPFTPNVQMKAEWLVVGGGGGGGGIAPNGTNRGSAGGGGAGGQVKQNIPTGATLAASQYTVNVGLRGRRGYDNSTPPESGGDGGVSYIKLGAATTVSSTGGTGGVGGQEVGGSGGTNGTFAAAKVGYYNSTDLTTSTYALGGGGSGTSLAGTVANFVDPLLPSQNKAGAGGKASFPLSPNWNFGYDVPQSWGGGGGGGAASAYGTAGLPGNFVNTGGGSAESAGAGGQGANGYAAAGQSGSGGGGAGSTGLTAFGGDGGDGVVKLRYRQYPEIPSPPATTTLDPSGGADLQPLVTWTDPDYVPSAATRPVPINAVGPLTRFIVAYRLHQPHDPFNPRGGPWTTYASSPDYVDSTDFDTHNVTLALTPEGCIAANPTWNCIFRTPIPDTVPYDYIVYARTATAIGQMWVFEDDVHNPGITGVVTYPTP